MQPTTAPVGRYRWRICAMLLAATTINYIDRQVLGVLAPDLQKNFHWSEVQYSHIVMAFQGAYAIGLLCAGAVIDRLGTRLGYALSIGIWSLAAMSCALAGNVSGFIAARFALGLGESGNFPAAIKVVAEWFPQRERALATGIFNSGSNIGAVVAPALVPVVALAFGWQAAFLITSALSAAWLIGWLRTYRTPDQQPKLGPAERAYIGHDPVNSERLPWLSLLRHRQAWAFIAGKALTDPVWWFYLSWLPKFLHSEYGLSLLQLGPPLIAIYVAADVGSIAGGWLGGHFIKRGWTVNRARKTAMFICALAVVPVIFASKASTAWGAVAVIGLATAGHQGWSANIFTVSSDLFPRRAVASMVGIAGFVGAALSVLVSYGVGLQLEATRNYMPLFVIAGLAYMLALLAVHLLAPRMQPAPIGQLEAGK